MIKRRLFKERVAAAVVTVAILAGTGLAEGYSPSFETSDLLTLKKRCGSADAVEGSLELIGKHAFGGPEFKTRKITAFEENRFFVHAVGSGSQGEDDPPQVLRRFIFLKPSTFVVEDRMQRSAIKGDIRRLLHSRQRQSEDTVGASRQTAFISETDHQFLLVGVLPKNVPLSAGGLKIIGEELGDHYLGIGVKPEGDATEIRLLSVLRLKGPDDPGEWPECRLDENDGVLQLTVTTAGRVFRLSLPPTDQGAGKIAVAKADGETLLKRRPLASGILPHGPQGTQLLERWDSAYRGGRPGWDVRRPASHLKKAVEEGTLRGGRALVLGCGAGTNAVYLASMGFDVTGIDIAPTALTLAEQRARKAKVEVRWLLANVLAPPKLPPFDVIFDRGCYHGVRRQNAAGYVQAVRRLSHGGAKLLLLAGSAAEPPPHYGPPRVKEAELRGDFAASFEVKWLRQTRFDSIDPAVEGPWAWSALLIRKEP